MNIEWNENPLKTKVHLDDRDRKMILYYIQSEEYANILCGLDMWMQGKIKKDQEITVEKIHERIKPWGPICNMDIDHDEVKLYEQDLLSIHVGDCTCLPATCGKCLAEEALGIDTIEGLGKHPAAKIFGLFDKYDDIDIVLEKLAEPGEYKKPDTWPNRVGYEEHIPRWESERKQTYKWLKAYKEEHGF